MNIPDKFKFEVSKKLLSMSPGLKKNYTAERKGNCYVIQLDIENATKDLELPVSLTEKYIKEGWLILK